MFTLFFSPFFAGCVRLVLVVLPPPQKTPPPFGTDSSKKPPSPKLSKRACSKVRVLLSYLIFFFSPLFFFKSFVCSLFLYCAFFFKSFLWLLICYAFFHKSPCGERKKRPQHVCVVWGGVVQIACPPPLSPHPPSAHRRACPANLRRGSFGQLVLSTTRRKQHLEVPDNVCIFLLTLPSLFSPFFLSSHVTFFYFTELFLL